jgi:DNA-binding transcriptional MerR regulator
MENKLTIQKMASKTGFSVHTLRYYEKIGLLLNVERDENGYRQYSEADVEWLEFLMRLKATGMPISVMKTFSDLRSKGESTTKERRKLLEEHHQQVVSEIEELQKNLEAIESKIQLYRKMEEEM